jgi:hypothetical protein
MQNDKRAVGYLLNGLKLELSTRFLVLLLIAAIGILLGGIYFSRVDLALGVIAILALVFTAAKLHKSGPKITLQLKDPKVVGTDITEGIYHGWRVPFMFVNDGERVGKVFDSFAKIAMPEVRNITQETVAFGPGSKSGFSVEHEKPVMGQVDLRLHPQTPGSDWSRAYVEAVKAGRVSVKIEISWNYGDSALRNAKGPMTISFDAPLFPATT